MCGGRGGLSRDGRGRGGREARGPEAGSGNGLRCHWDRPAPSSAPGPLRPPAPSSPVWARPAPGALLPASPGSPSPAPLAWGGPLETPLSAAPAGPQVWGAQHTGVPPPRVSSLSARVVFTRVASWSARCSVKEMCDSPVSPGAGEGRGGPGVRPTRTGSGGRGECVSVMAQCWVTGRRPLWLGPWVLPDVARRASCGPFFWKIGSSGSWV